MHCPRCGQQQVSEDTRFCSRCGFPLGLISEILAHGGVLPQLADLHKKKKKFWTRKNGLKIALLWFLVLTLLITPLAGIAGADEGAGVFAVLGVMGGLLMMVISFMFLEKEPKFSRQIEVPYQAIESPYQTANYFGGNAAGQNALPPQQSQPVQDFVPPAAGGWKAPNTGELAKPHSVTEGTTKLLQKDE